MESTPTPKNRSAGSTAANGLDGCLIVAICSAAVFLFAHLSAFTSPFVINDDVRQQIYWMQKWRDPDLFRGDWLSDYARQYVPWGMQGIYWVACWICGPILFSKILPGILFVFLACCLYGIGASLGGRSLGWASVCAFWLMPFFLDNLSGGLARAFAAPLLALFWLCWLRGKPWGMGAALLLQALFIPYVFPLCAAAVLMACAGAKLLGRPLPPFPSRWLHAPLLILGIGLVALWNQAFSASGFGPLVTAIEMAGRAEFSPQGRYPILPLPSLGWEVFVSPFQDLAATSNSGWVAMTVICCALLLGLAAYGVPRVRWRNLRHHLQPVACLALGSLTMYVLARLFLLRLFVPSRYIMYTINLLLCLALGLCLKAALERWGLPRRGSVFVVLLAVVLGGLRLQGVGLFDYSQYRPLFASLSQTPKGALIAGHPALMDNVPTFAQRRAFATFELAHPWSRGLWQRLKPRLEDLFAAYYATDPEVVRAFSAKYGIDFLVVDDRHFTPEFIAGTPFFAPFDDLIRGLAQGRRDFALLREGPFPRMTVDEHIRILDVGHRVTRFRVAPEGGPLLARNWRRASLEPWIQ